MEKAEVVQSWGLLHKKMKLRDRISLNVTKKMRIVPAVSRSRRRDA